MIRIGRFVDYYTELKIPADATQEDIVRAYNARIVELDGLLPEIAAQRRTILDRAYAILSDEAARFAYDVNGEGGA